MDERSLTLCEDLDLFSPLNLQQLQFYCLMQMMPWGNQKGNYWVGGGIREDEAEVPPCWSVTKCSSTVMSGHSFALSDQFFLFRNCFHSPSTLLCMMDCRVARRGRTMLSFAFDGDYKERLLAAHKALDLGLVPQVWDAEQLPDIFQTSGFVFSSMQVVYMS